MIAALKSPCLLDGEDVARLLNDAENFRVPARVLAKPTELRLRNAVAAPAETNLLLDGAKGFRQGLDLAPLGFQQVKDQALSRLGPYPRKPPQL